VVKFPEISVLFTAFTFAVYFRVCKIRNAAIPTRIKIIIRVFISVVFAELIDEIIGSFICYLVDVNGREVYLAGLFFYTLPLHRKMPLQYSTATVAIAGISL
jgi:hypothetical protein